MRFTVTPTEPSPRGTGYQPVGRHGLLARATCAVLLLIATGARTPPANYFNDFEKERIGRVPDDLMVLDGVFAVRAVDDNKCLELAGDPIGSFGALFGPEAAAATDVKARVWAASTGKRFPEFGIGAGGAGGYRLLLAPGRHALELRKGEDTKTLVAADWRSRSWTWFRLRVERYQGGWAVRGKVWPQGRNEPANWMIETADPEPPGGKASVWANDFSEQPIRFDDLSVTLPDGSNR